MPAIEKFVIFDGNALLHRAFHALPPLTTRDGRLVNAVYGFTSIFLRVLKELKPTYAAVTFDRKEKTFRHELYQDYKATRIKKPQELYDQIPLIKEVVVAFNIPIYELAGFEADDIIGTICSHLAKSKPRPECIIVTGDLDTLQLIDEHTKVYTPKKGLSDTVLYDLTAVRERYGVEPKQLIDFKALRGDPSDNILGVKGIGEKTALELIRTFGSIEGLYEQLKHKPAGLSLKLIQLLEQAEAEARLSKHLVTIVRDAKFDFDVKQAKLQAFNYEKLVTLFQKLEFKSLLPRLPELQRLLNLEVVEEKNEAKPAVTALKNYTLVDTEAALNALNIKLKECKVCALAAEMHQTVNGSQLYAVSLALNDGTYFINPVTVQTAPSWTSFVALLADEKIAKVGHNLKKTIGALATEGITLSGVRFDTEVAAYLLRSGEHDLDLKSLAFQEFGLELASVEELLGVNKVTVEKLTLAEVANSMRTDVDCVLKLKERFTPELERLGLTKLFHEIEMPLVPVLASMESRGVKIDGEYLSKLAVELAKILNKLEKEIHALAGHEFNINSPKQLKTVLFDELKIPSDGLKHTKTGVSTAAAELEKMRGLHPIIEHMFEWRELSKLVSTYVEAIPKLMDKKGRVHTTFNQAVTATGRLSSSDPNLQNIPIRTEWGNKIRQAFIAEKGFKLLAADYSQIELRLVAHIARDQKMIEIFKKREDIHRSTAAFILGIPAEQVTREQRRSAKEINFGVLYGMGAWGLAERTGLSRSEAQDFIIRYFKAYPKVASWIEQTKEEAKRQGFVATLFGRRRYLPDINSGMAQVRAAAERMAVNLPVQGTGADLMKKAMVNVQAGLGKVSGKSSMIIQVHDELVFEVPEKEVVAVAAFVKKEMENAVQLDVPIVVDVKVGANWREMEQLAV